MDHTLSGIVSFVKPVNALLEMFHTLSGSVTIPLQVWPLIRMCYADGLLEKDGKSIDLREVENDLRQIKGIGDKRVKEIMAVFEKHLAYENSR